MLRLVDRSIQHTSRYKVANHTHTWWSNRGPSNGLSPFIPIVIEDLRLCNRWKPGPLCRSLDYRNTPPKNNVTTALILQPRGRRYSSPNLGVRDEYWGVQGQWFPTFDFRCTTKIPSRSYADHLICKRLFKTHAVAENTLQWKTFEGKRHYLNNSNPYFYIYGTIFMIWYFFHYWKCVYFNNIIQQTTCSTLKYHQG